MNFYSRFLHFLTNLSEFGIRNMLIMPCGICVCPKKMGTRKALLLLRRYTKWHLLWNRDAFWTQTTPLSRLCAIQQGVINLRCCSFYQHQSKQPLHHACEFFSSFITLHQKDSSQNKLCTLLQNCVPYRLWGAAES